MDDAQSGSRGVPPPISTLLNGSLASSLRGSQLSSIYHSIGDDGHTSGGLKSTSEATTVQLNRTFINYNDTLSQSNPSSSTLTLNTKRNLTLNDARLKKIYSVTGENLFGLAPLASPESLSEISSISSLPNGSRTPCDEYESQMHTPKILRRAPKISAPLSNIDWRTIQEYEKLGQVFYATSKVPSDDDDIYRSPSKVSKSNNSLDEAKQSTNFNFSDGCLDTREAVSSSGTFTSAVSSLSGIFQHGGGSLSHSKLLNKLNSVTFEEEDHYMSRVTPEGVIESHFPVFYDLNDPPPIDKQNGGRYDASSINEALPLLANLNERTGVSFVKRKNYIYPVQSSSPKGGYRVVTSPQNLSQRSSSQSLGRNESSV